MNDSCIHLSKFGYFYSYCLLNEQDKKIKREISKIKRIVTLTNNLDAANNTIFNKKLARKEKRVENVLLQIAEKCPDFLLNLTNEEYYTNTHTHVVKETDPKIVARNIAQSFYDAYYTKNIKKGNIVSKKNKYKAKESDIVLTLSLDEQAFLAYDEDIKEFEFFLNELKKCKYPNINRQIDKLNSLITKPVNKDQSKEEYEQYVNRIIRYAYNNVDMIFKKGFNYPFKREFIKVLSKVIYLYDIQERKPSELKNYIKKCLYTELLDKYTTNENLERTISNYGYEIPSDTSTEMLIKVNEDLKNEKLILIEKVKRGEKINYDRPYSNTIQVKKVDLINSYFDSRFDCKLTKDSKEEIFVEHIMNLCELADDITDDLFKKVLFDAHDSSNLTLIQSYAKNEALRTLYSLYPPMERLEKYEKSKTKFEQVFKNLNTFKRDIIYKRVYEEKQKKHIPINELVPSKETILNNLVIRETKFIDSHAVEEFKHKALNFGKYLNYDLEIVARDIDVNELPAIYQKLKRNIMYTNFVAEIKPGEDRERKYKEARIIQKKTLAVAQEMIAKTILNKSYIGEHDISYDSYQVMLDDIYENILHEERLLRRYDDVDDEYESVEKLYQEKKKEWDENSSFVKALYLVVAKKEG